MKSIFLTVCLLLLVGTAAAQDFPRFLGPRGNGMVSTETTIRTSFDGGFQQFWLIPLPDRNGVRGSPVVAEDRAYYLAVVNGNHRGGQLRFAKNKGWEKKHKKTFSEKGDAFNDFSSPILCGDVLALLTQGTGKHKKDLCWNLVNADIGNFRHRQLIPSKVLGRIYSTPAVADGRLFIKGAAGFACWDLRP